MAKHAFLIAMSVLLAGPWARAEMLRIGVEPIVGYELVQKVMPTPHVHNRLIYGARVTAGILLISAEGEYTRASDREEYPDVGLSQTDTADRLKLGLRSGFHLGPMVTFSLRGGVQASRVQREEVVDGVSSITVDPIAYKPYAGTGLRFTLTPKISASAEIVAVINDTNDLTKNEYQTTAGFQIRLP